MCSHESQLFTREGGGGTYVLPARCTPRGVGGLRAPQKLQHELILGVQLDGAAAQQAHAHGAHGGHRRRHRRRLERLGWGEGWGSSPRFSGAKEEERRGLSVQEKEPCLEY